MNLFKKIDNSARSVHRRRSNLAQSKDQSTEISHKLQSVFFLSLFLVQTTQQNTTEKTIKIKIKVKLDETLILNSSEHLQQTN